MNLNPFRSLIVEVLRMLDERGIWEGEKSLLHSSWGTADIDNEINILELSRQFYGMKPHQIVVSNASVVLPVGRYFQRASPPMTAILASEYSLMPLKMLMTSAAAESSCAKDRDMLRRQS